MDFLNCFGEFFRSFSKYTNFIFSVIVGDYIKLCSFFTDCVVVTLAKVIWKLQRMVSLLCHFSVFLLVCLKHCPCCRKQKHVKLQISTNQKVTWGRGDVKPRAVLSWVPAALCANTSVSVSLSDLFLIKQRLRVVILVQLSPCIKGTLYKL